MLLSTSAVAQVVIRGGQHEDSQIRERSDGDEQIRQQIIQESVSASSCGRRSAYSRPGGASPLCYPSDVTDEMVAEWKQQHADE